MHYMNSTAEDSSLAKQNIGPALVAVSWVFAALATLVVGTRYYTRLQILKKFGIEDWLILATYLFALANSAFCTISAHYGLGRHIQFLQPEQILFSIKYIYLCEFFSIMSPGIGRISYAFLLLEIIPPTKWRKQFLWGIITAQLIVDVGTVIVSFSQCQPITDFWERPPDANCWDPVVQEYTGFFQGSVCSLVDLLLAGFPASLFWSLQMKLSTKVSLSFLMGLGFFAMICSIVKTIQLRAITEHGDLTYRMCELAIWWTLEAYMVLIAASIPTLRPLTTRGRSGQSRNSSKKSSNYKLSDIQSNQTPGASGNGGSPFVTISSNRQYRRGSDEEALAVGGVEDDRSETGSGAGILNDDHSHVDYVQPTGNTITKQTSVSITYDR